ncbi:hypothetical protein BH20VER2_BH20VER2_02260 [soil metagenome]
MFLVQFRREPARAAVGVDDFFRAREVVARQVERIVERGLER